MDSGFEEVGVKTTLDDDSGSDPGADSAPASDDSEYQDYMDEYDPAEIKPNDEDLTMPFGRSVEDTALPDHVEADVRNNVYLCAVCGDDYSAQERDDALACCDFTGQYEQVGNADDGDERPTYTKSDVLAKAEYIRDRSENDGDVHGRLGRLVGQAAKAGISVEFGELLTAGEEEVEDSEGAGAGEDDAEATAVEQTDRKVETTFRARFSQLSESQLEEYGITENDAKFLGMVVDALTPKGVPGYSLMESMRKLVEVTEADVDTLIDLGYLKQHKVVRRKYFTVTPKGRSIIGKSHTSADGVGDLGEETPHRVGVLLLEKWISQQHDVARTERYYRFSDDTKFDAVGLDENEELVWVGEMERPSKDGAELKDLEKMRQVGDKSIWAFEKKDDVIETLETLSDADAISLELGYEQKRSMSRLQEAVEAAEEPGIEYVTILRKIDNEVNK